MRMNADEYKQLDGTSKLMNTGSVRFFMCSDLVSWRSGPDSSCGLLGG